MKAPPPCPTPTPQAQAGTDHDADLLALLSELASRESGADAAQAAEDSGADEEGASLLARQVSEQGGAAQRAAEAFLRQLAGLPAQG